MNLLIKLRAMTGQIAFTIFTLAITCGAAAGVDGALSGSIVDGDGVAVSGARVLLENSGGRILKESRSDATGNFSFFPIEFGVYHVVVSADGLASNESTTDVSAGSAAKLNIKLVPAAAAKKEYVVNVVEKRNLVQVSSSGSKVDVDQSRIKTLPGGDTASLPKIISTITPGVVQGPFGQMFIRGNHANVQYQIDGVQLPESTSGSFGDAFNPRNIDHMEVITGGIPAEYGERLAAVVNVVTKSGTETPEGTAEVKIGSQNTIQPQISYGGSDNSGKLRYYLTGNYFQTDRGLDTPDPASYSDQSHGGTSPVHDHAHGNDEFGRVDYQLNDTNKFSLNLFNSNRFYEIPNYPDSFKSTDGFFQPGYTDQFGNQNSDPTKPTYKWAPSNTNDTQTEQNSYAEFVWKKTFSDRAFLQVAPYYKRSKVDVGNDPTNDLATLVAGGPNAITGSQATSFAMQHTVDNFGVKADYTLRLTDSHLLKSGLQTQQSNGTGSFSLQTDPTQAASQYQISDTGYTEAVYVQDAYTITKPLTLNAGLRYTAVQFNSDSLHTQDGLLQPRVGLEYLATSSTKVHAFYGKLFQPAPFENLREAFTGVGGGNSAVPYDLKAEKDDYYEAGLAQQLGQSHVISLTYYYKDATDMLDDAQLLNTSIAQPYNFSTGYATGLELSATGDIVNNLSYFANYSYEDARGKGLSGGIFAFDPSTQTNGDYQFLDHCQLNTANLGLTYKVDSYWASLTGLYGSGLRTGPNNALSLPSHTTFDATVGYRFHDENFWSKWRLSADVINILDNAYPINVNNGFNGSHYAAGRQWFIHLAKEI